MLVWYEQHPTMDTAIQREKSLKRYLREWKLKLIEDLNPEWRDLSAGWFEDEGVIWLPDSPELK